MYQSSGLAEIVRNPSSITKKYLDLWFTGESSFGTALKLLSWPINKSSAPLLVLSKNMSLQIDLKVEEKVMYSKTIFHYVKGNGAYTLKIDPVKLFSPKSIWGTVLATWSQSKLLFNYQNTYNIAKNYVESIPLDIPKNKKEVEQDIKNVVLPYLIAVDYIGEFIYSALVNNLENSQKIELLTKLQKRISPSDWYTQAILAWNKLQDKQISKTKFLSSYGFAAGNDYELTVPRYYEILKLPKPQIKKIEIESLEVKSLEDLYVGTQYLRSQAKLKSLIWISALRDLVKS